MTLQGSISKAESDLIQSQSLSLDLASIVSDIDERKSRVEKIRTNIQNAKYDAKVQEITIEARTLEEQREALHAELKSLSLQADARAKLDLKRADLRTKSQELKNIVEMNNVKFRKLIGLDIRIETMERDVERVIRYASQRHQRKAYWLRISEKEREAAEAETKFNDLNGQWQRLESTLSNLKEQLKQKRALCKGTLWFCINYLDQ